MNNAAYITQTLQQLVRINSVNPSLEDTGAGEQDIGKFIANELRNIGIVCAIDEIKPDRINVTGVIQGSGGGKSLILNAHMDTVGVAGMDGPFSGSNKNGKIYGRGSYDMKGSIAAILAVAKALIEQKKQLKGDLIFSFVADEEYESLGANSFVEKYSADAAIVTEPTDLKICLAHRGFGIFKIITTGKTAHGGNHRLGVDANAKMGLLLARLVSYAKSLPEKKLHSLCGEASIHVPLIKGGKSLFIYSNECVIHAERRTIPGETLKEVTDELYHMIKKLEAENTNFNASIECILWRDPYEISQNRDIVQQLSKVSGTVLGKSYGYIGHTWWEDSAIFGNAGIETVIIGPKGGGIHEEIEWVEIDSVIKLSNILYHTAISYCS